jgi:LmbE family N-acetylglucosaminyl deacetylase
MAFAPTADTPAFDHWSRVLLIAPHPDDETLACSVILQKALAARAALRIVYLTDGDNNPWLQRFLEWKWHLDVNDRRRWGSLRRTEALAALSVLGVSGAQVRFIGLPDQSLTELLLCDCEIALAHFAEIVEYWAPTHIFSPSNFDTHPDHNAVAVMLRLVLAECFPDAPEISHWNYLVHGQSPAFFARATALSQSESEIANKREAILCHRTQLQLSKRRFLGYVTRPERVVRIERDQVACCDGSICSISRNGDMLRIDLRPPSVRPHLSQSALLVLGRSSNGEHRSFSIRLPVRSGPVEIVDYRTNCVAGAAFYQRDASTAEVMVPLQMLSRDADSFIKFNRRSWFFDEAGWIHVPACTQRCEATLLREDEQRLLARR